MTEKQFTDIEVGADTGRVRLYNGINFMEYSSSELLDLLNELVEENEQLQKKLNKLEKFEHGGEHIRLSINIETGELQRHIYATGQWFGDFDRVLVKNWISEEDYQRFINRIIEVYNTEFKKD